MLCISHSETYYKSEFSLEIFFKNYFIWIRAPLIAQLVKNLSAMQEIWV